MPMLPGLHGLWVDAGRYDVRAHRWVREPVAEFTCRHGCTRAAAGETAVRQFCRAITAWHLAHCPALRTTTGSTDET
jgi:hypothetical protein